MPITVATIREIIEQTAPTSLAENWDNPGLQIGSDVTVVTGVLTVLDVTEECVEYAIEKGYNLIISHHPMFLKGIKSIDVTTLQGKLIETLLCHHISVYSAHTNMDVAKGGLNDMAAARLGLRNVKGLVETAKSQEYKVVTFVPEESAGQMREALWKIGAGQIGYYAGCSFSVRGEGSFRPVAGAHPAFGTIGNSETVTEVRLEVQVPQALLQKTLDTIAMKHSYETPVCDVYSLAVGGEKEYIGRIGKLPTGVDEESFKALVKKAFPEGRVRFGGAHCGSIDTIALCTGAGVDFMEIAKRAGAQAYVTGDVKYHDMQQARALNLLVADAGHFGTECYVAEGFATLIKDGIVAAGGNENGVEIENFVGQKDYFFNE